MSDTYKVNLGYVVIKQRQVREGNTMLFQFRSITHNPDGSVEISEWSTSGVIDNYGDVFDKEPSMWQRFCDWWM